MCDLNNLNITFNIVNSTLFNRNKNKIIKDVGIWKIELRTNGKLIFTKNFLVISSDSSLVIEKESGHMKKEWIENFKLFYKFESICFKAIENSKLNQSYFHAKMFKRCEAAKWSSFYPDPKSDIFSRQV